MMSYTDRSRTFKGRLIFPPVLIVYFLTICPQLKDDLGKKNHAHKVFDSDCFLLLCIKIFEHAQSSGALFAILCIETSQIIPCLLK